jgi:hypothetical protein
LCSLSARTASGSNSLRFYVGSHCARARHLRFLFRRTANDDNPISFEKLLAQQFRVAFPSGWHNPPSLTAQIPLDARRDSPRRRDVASRNFQPNPTSQARSPGRATCADGNCGIDAEGCVSSRCAIFATSVSAGDRAEDPRGSKMTSKRGDALFSPLSRTEGWDERVLRCFGHERELSESNI